MMKKASKCIIAVILTICVFGLFPSVDGSMTVNAETNEETNTQTDIYPQTVVNYNSTLRDNNYLTTTDDGYMRVYYDGAKVGIEYYDSDLNIVSAESVEMELDVWGGFYKGNDAYYLVEGAYNTDDDDDAEVIRVIKYDFDWNKQGAAKVTSNVTEIRIPFSSGNVNMAEYDGTLYIVTGHQGYYDPGYGMGHQGFLMIAVDESTMDWSIPDADLWHSFAQYIRAEGSDLYVLEQSDGNRCTQLSLYNAVDKKLYKSFSVLDYGGTHTSAWAIACYASVDGLELSGSNVLSIGSSIDQSLYDSVTSTTPHNIYLTVTPKSDMSKSATTVKWLTDYEDDGENNGKTFTNVKLTKINDNRFLVSWGEWDGEIHEATDTNDLFSGYTMHYVFVDGNGDKLTEEYTASGLISDCQPIVNGSDVVFLTCSSNTLNFYTIDANSGDFSKKIYRRAGDGVTWEMDSNGTLTLSGSGVIETEQSEFSIVPVSTTSGIFVTSSSSAWAPIRNSITTIKINDGITGIGEEAFYRFYNCREIYIPDSVTSIGTDALWSGYFSIWNDAHIVYMTIYCNSGSCAHEYAEENGIGYVLLDEIIGDVNGDTKVNDKDVVALARYVAGWGNTIELSAADVDGNGKVNDKDVVMLARKVAGWDV